MVSRTRTTRSGRTTRTSTAIRRSRSGRGRGKIQRVRASSIRPRVKVVRRVQTPTRIKSSARRVVSVRKPIRKRVTRATPVGRSTRRKVQLNALRNPIKNFVAPAIGSIRGAGKATRQIVDTEIADFNIRTKRKGTEVEFPSTSKFIDFFGATELGN